MARLHLAVAYAVGATLTQALFLAIHELTHNLFFASPARNRAFAILVNLPVGVPFCAAFRGYHLEHHAHQGVEGVDTDLPSALERRLARGPLATPRASLQIVARACLLPRAPAAADGAPRGQPGRAARLRRAARARGGGARCATCGCACSWRAAPPVRGALPLGAPAPSRRGAPGDGRRRRAAGDLLLLRPAQRAHGNVGYHNEHHDFPAVPWSRLPALTRLAPEFYDGLATCDSWPGAIWAYVARADMGPHRRVTRPR